MDAKSEIAKEKPRDEKGHFIKNNINISKTNNDEKLVNLQVSNPLTRITKLLEDIKKQKAFAFTIKGSLGILGVALAISVFGIFGGSKMLCDKGIQTEIGTVSVLDLKEIEASPIWFLGPTIDYYKEMFGLVDPKTIHNRLILVTKDLDTIYIPYSRFVPMEKYDELLVATTGSYDSCSNTLKVTDPNAIQIIEPSQLTSELIPQ